ncbi:MAG: sugar phosphate isomerase/epimerase [Parafilimonas sp.]
MSYTRRKFLQTGGLFAAGTFAGVNTLKASCNKKLENFGLQLWTLRDDMPKDPKEVLKQVASFGYTQIESFEGKQGIFWGMTASDFKKYMDDLEMKIVSSHCDISKDFEKKAADAASIDMKYLICPYKGPQKSIDDFKRFADEFNAKGEICRKNGIRFAYHNHDYSWKSLDGQIPQEVMMNNTNPETVDYEMDIYWVVTAGADPQYYLKKYENRFRLVHAKDRKKNVDASEHDASCILGTGQINFPEILHTARKCGTKYFIVEQERYDNSTPLQSTEADAKYMKQISI